MMTHKRRADEIFGIGGLLLWLAPLLALASPAAAQAVDFRGETIAIQIAYGPAGGY